MLAENLFNCMSRRREKIRINGIVQGVGFRPFIYRLAQECRLGGFVNNCSDGVVVELEGTPQAIDQFHTRVRREAPPLLHIFNLSIEEIAPQGEILFSIIESSRNTTPATFISPDVCICSDCLSELFDPANRRYHYPFINCTNCGPRYTIVHGIPYDRPNTSMRIFPMCSACNEEYHDPGNRRFHAQPNACPECGPKVSLHDHSGQQIKTGDPVQEAVELLRQGTILAIRGLGGFHLAVDARNNDAVQELRRRKGRAEKPFALMALDVANVEKYCAVSSEEKELLQQPVRPIVLLKAHAPHNLAKSIAPGNRYLGFMLPYTPLHYLLVKENFDALVMTSGNYSEEPIAIGNQEAIERLSSLADYFLLHDRDILQRCDDSIVRWAKDAPRLIRRSRGYVPAPVLLPHPVRQNILACGGELKNTIALSRENAVFLSQHIGDLDNPAALAFFENSIAHLQRIFEITPALIAHDLHPEYLSTKWALQQEHLPRIGVQHHHAHLVSVMAENGVVEKTVGLILDGTGYGTDGTIWGGEVLVGDAQSFDRYAWLQPVAMPGGGAAIRQPWRMALSYLHTAFGEKCVALDLPFLRRQEKNQQSLITQMIEKKLNSPLTSSCGRLFDAISAMLDIRQEVSYEAQAAIELEMIADETDDDFYSDSLFEKSSAGSISIIPLIQCVVNDIHKNERKEQIAAKFHNTLVELFLQIVCTARDATSINRVGLSGGVYQNVFFFTTMLKRLQEEGFEVLTHRQVPTNDGGIALGQVVIADANARLD